MQRPAALSAVAALVGSGTADSHAAAIRAMPSGEPPPAVEIRPRDAVVGRRPKQTRLVPDAGIEAIAAAAAKAVADDGGSPRAQLDAARKHSAQRLTYKPHQGARERARVAARLAAQADHSVDATDMIDGPGAAG